MKSIALAALAAALVTFSAQSAGAMDSMHSAMMMPTCSSGDPVVGMNMMNKMYMTRDQMNMKMAGMSDSKKSAMMTKNHVKMMCMSKAKMMGAKMMH